MADETGSIQVVRHVSRVREALRGKVRNECRIALVKVLDEADKELRRNTTMQKQLDQVADMGMDPVKSYRVTPPNKPKDYTEDEWASALSALMAKGWLTSPMAGKYRIEIGEPVGGR